MATNISFRDVQFTDQAGSVLITVITDIPCHLYCRLTYEEPRIHTRSILRRGVDFMSELRFCFVSYEDNEQAEAGDTLTHTWVKPSWGFCITKHCYFWGKIAGAVSKSTSPIFTHHNVYSAPPPVPINVGDNVQPYSASVGRSYTFINTSTPASGTGTITQIDLWNNASAASTLHVGLFFLVAGTTYQCRSAVLLNVAGTSSHQYFTVSLPVVTGDVIAWFTNIINLKCNPGTCTGKRRPSTTGDKCTVGLQTNFSVALTLCSVALHGLGST